MGVNPDNPKVMIRRSYKIRKKRKLVNQITELVSPGRSWLKACVTVVIPYLYYRRWNNLIKKVDSINESNEFVPYNTKGSSQRVHTGCKSVLAKIQPQLKTFIFKIREQGIQVTNRMVARVAVCLLLLFREKSL
jgi:hypothetical protein